MATDSTASFLEAWTEGAQILLGSVLGAILALLAAVSLGESGVVLLPAHPLSVIGIVLGGFTLTFLAFSWLFYGR